MIRRPPRSTRTDTLFPYTTLFRSERSFWAEQVRALSDTRQCVTLDMPGHGASGWRDGLDLDGIAEDIALWIIEHGAAPVTIVGHSKGGMIAMRIAARYPALVERLVLVNTRSEERRVGKECVSQCRSRGA